MTNYCTKSVDLESRMADIMTRRRTIASDISDSKREISHLKELLRPASPAYSVHESTSGSAILPRITRNVPDESVQIAQSTRNAEARTMQNSNSSQKTHYVPFTIPASNGAPETVKQDGKEQRFGAGWDVDFELDLL